MKRGSELARTPMKRGTSELKRSGPLTTKKPMARGESQLARAVKPIRARSKTNSNPRPATGEAKLCKGQPCYLRIPGACTGAAHDPCHSNQAAHGKGKGIKAHDVYTVPGCRSCHEVLDQGARFTRAEKFALWDDAYARWQPVRDQLAAIVVKKI